MEPINRTVANMMTRPKLSDVFSYRNRASKRLLRQLVKLADELSQSASICNEAIAVEVWYAAIAFIYTGHRQLSRSDEIRKTAVLERFVSNAMDLVTNEVLIPTATFKKTDPSLQQALWEDTNRQLTSTLRIRCDEYKDAIQEYLKNGRNSYPQKIGALLTRNLFANSTDLDSIRAEMTTVVAMVLLNSFLKAGRT